MRIIVENAVCLLQRAAGTHAPPPGLLPLLVQQPQAHTLQVLDRCRSA